MLTGRRVLIAGLALVAALAVAGLVALLAVSEIARQGLGDPAGEGRAMTAGTYRHFARIFEVDPSAGRSLDELQEGHVAVPVDVGTPEPVFAAEQQLRDAVDRGDVDETELETYVERLSAQNAGLFYEGAVGSSPSIWEDLRAMAIIVDEGQTTIEDQAAFLSAHLAIWVPQFCQGFGSGAGPAEVRAYYQAECIAFEEFIGRQHPGVKPEQSPGPPTLP